MIVTKQFLRKFSVHLHWILIGGYFCWCAIELMSVTHNIDEGVYLAKAGLLAEGKKPFSDFFFHQPPLYIFFLKIFIGSGHEIFLARLCSLLALCLSSAIIYQITRTVAGRKGALIALLLFISNCLHVHSLLAMPTALMLFFASAGICVMFGKKRYSAVIAGALFAISVQFKPLTIFWLPAVAFYYLWQKKDRTGFLFFTAAFVLIGACATAYFIIQSNGGYAELLLSQTTQYSKESAFAIWIKHPAFQEIMRVGNVRTPLDWSLFTHSRVFFHSGILNPNFLLMILAVIGLLMARRFLISQLSLIALGGILLSCLFVWGPIWDHYFVQYIPFLAMGVGFMFRAKRSKLITTIVLAVCVLGFVIQAKSREILPSGIVPGAKVLSFDPYINIFYRAQHACGLVDSLTAYGSSNEKYFDRIPRFRKSVINEDMLEACLKSDSEVVFFVGFWFTQIRDRKVLEFLRSVNPNRIIFQNQEFYTIFQKLRMQAAAVESNNKFHPANKSAERRR
jgi:4-amino-4-deoxy-L-arabinose transferase-like glycosyltransferase